MTTEKTKVKRDCARWLDTVSDEWLDDQSQVSLVQEAWKRGALTTLKKVRHRINYALGCIDHDQPEQCEMCFLRHKALKEIDWLGE